MRRAAGHISRYRKPGAWAFPWTPGVLLAVCGAAILHAQESAYLPLLEFEKVASFAREEIRAISKSPSGLFTLVGQKSGIVRELDANGVLQEIPLLDITKKVVTSTAPQSSRGLIDVIPSPNAGENALIVSYTSTAGDYLLRISKFSLPAGGETVLIDVPFGEGSNSSRMSGDLAAGPDGLLYIGVGDGSYAERPDASILSQDLASFRGKVLRIKVGESPDDAPYSIPSGNPFADNAETLPEIWLLGVRRPWLAFDNDGATLFLLDQVARQSTLSEEINVLPFRSAGGLNLGWPRYSGDSAGNRDPDYRFPEFDSRQHRFASDLEAAEAFAWNGVVHAATARMDGKGGIRQYFAMAPESKHGWLYGHDHDPCCREGATAVGLGHDNVRFYGSRDGGLYRAVKAATLQAPRVQPNTTDNGQIIVGGTRLIVETTPFYIPTFYTIDGSIPNIHSLPYDIEDPPLLAANGTYRGVAYHPDIGYSEVTTSTFGLQAAPVRMEVLPPFPSHVITVRLSTETSEASIRYTLDGGEPGADSPLYDMASGLVISGPGEVRITAKAFHPEFAPSITSTHFVYPSLAPPAIVGDQRIFYPGQEMALATAPGPSISYNLDRAVEADNEVPYRDPFPIGEASLVHAVASLDGYQPVGQWFDVTFRNPLAASVKRVAGGGQVLPEAGMAHPLTVRIDGPVDLANAPDGSVFVLGSFDRDRGSQLLFTIRPDGNVTVRRFTGEPSRFTDLAVRSNGDVILAAPDYPGLAVLSPTAEVGAALAYIAVQRSEHLCTMPDGSIYVSDQWALSRVSSDNVVETVGGQGFAALEDAPLPVSSVRFDRLGPLAPGPDGSILLMDRARLLQLDGNGIIRPVAGNAAHNGHRDGVGANTLLNDVQWITSDANGYVYLPNNTSYPDFGERPSIRVISPEGRVATASFDSNIDALAEIRGMLVTGSGILVCADNAVYLLNLADSDFDLVPDQDERAPLVVGQRDTQRDTDGDGYADAVEHLFGSDPLDASATPPVPDYVPLAVAPYPAVAIHLPTVSGKTYRLEASDNLLDWRPVETFQASGFRSTLRVVFPESWRKVRYFRGTQLKD